MTNDNSKIHESLPPNGMITNGIQTGEYSGRPHVVKESLRSYASNGVLQPLRSDGRTPMDRYFEESQHTPFWEDVQASYDPSREFIRYNNYRIDLKAIRFQRNNDGEL